MIKGLCAFVYLGCPSTRQRISSTTLLNLGSQTAADQSASRDLRLASNVISLHCSTTFQELFRKFSEMEKKHPGELRLFRAYNYLEQGQIKSEVDDLDYVLKHPDPYVTYYLSREAPYLRSSTRDEALEKLKLDTYLERSDALDKLGRQKEALTDLSAAIDIDPDDTDNRILRAMMLSNMGRHKDAITDMELALTKDDVTNRIILAMIYERMGDIQNARRTYEESAKTMTLDSGAITNAFVYKKLGNESKYKAAMKEAKDRQELQDSLAGQLFSQDCRLPIVWNELPKQHKISKKRRETHG